MSDGAGVVTPGTAGQPDPNCPFCRDLPGSVHDDGTAITVLGPGRLQRNEYLQAGQVLEGAVTFTWLSVLLPGHLDLLTLTLAQVVVNNEYHKRGDADPIGRSTERLTLPAAAILSVERASARVGTDLVRYAYGDAFTVDDAGAILWDDGPPAGTIYSVRYVARPVFVIWDPQSRDEGGSKQPYRTLAQRLDYFRQPVVGD